MNSTIRTKNGSVVSALVPHKVTNNVTVTSRPLEMAFSLVFKKEEGKKNTKKREKRESRGGGQKQTVSEKMREEQNHSTLQEFGVRLAALHPAAIISTN